MTNRGWNSIQGSESLSKRIGGERKQIELHIESRAAPAACTFLIIFARFCIFLSFFILFVSSFVPKTTFLLLEEEKGEKRGGKEDGQCASSCAKFNAPASGSYPGIVPCLGCVMVFGFSQRADSGVALVSVSEIQVAQTAR